MMPDRFWRKVQKTDGCWLWMGGKATKRGYGRFSWRSRPCLAHRVAWELTNGPIPPALHVLHKCDNPRCVRPDHLFLGTQADNNHDAMQKARQTARGQPSRWKPRLTERPAWAHEIQRTRAALGETVVTFGQRFGYSGRQVERWEQGSRAPDPLTQQLINELSHAALRP